MSDTKKDQNFLDLADSFINLANQHGKTNDKGVVSATFLYAAARFNAFIIASSSTDAQQMLSNTESAKEYFIEEFKKMLDEHFADYGNNFQQYLKPKSDVSQKH